MGITKNRSSQPCESTFGHARALWGKVLLAGLLLVGCEADSFLNPSVVGRWERTPVVLPILDRLDVIDEPEARVEGLSPVQAEDLIPVIHEYVIGPGDIIAITVFELVSPNFESVLVRRVDELGMVRLPVIGGIKAQGTTPSELESKIVGILDARGVIKDAMVSVVVQDGRQNTFSVIGEPRLSGTAIGTYVIPKSNFRILDAMALARGASGSIKKLFVIRQTPLSAKTQEVIPRSDRGGQKKSQPTDSLRDPVELIEDLLSSVDRDFEDKPQAPTGPAAVPSSLDNSMDTMLDQPAQWVHVNGRWVRVDSPAGAAAAQGPAKQPGTDAGAATPPPVTQRIIEIAYDRLLDGDMRYNAVIRPGDVIRVPPPVIGNVYIGGGISRPGTYSLPGDKDLTLKQLIFSAGNLSPTAIPERVDLIRRVGDDQEATVRLNLREIFEGIQPDFYLKPNDTINIGTNFASTPLAVVRSGFRTTYGFGFLLDRNFGPDVFGPVPQDRN